MTIPRLASMTRYWDQHPPIHVLVSAYLGYKAKDDKPKVKGAIPADAIEQMMAAFPQVKR